MDLALVDVEAVDGGGRKGSVAQESARSTTMRREGSARIRSRKCQDSLRSAKRRNVAKPIGRRSSRLRRRLASGSGARHTRTSFFTHILFQSKVPRRPPAQQALAKVAIGW